MPDTSRPDDLRLAASLLEAMTGEAPQRLTSPDAVLAALEAGQGPVWVELPWREQRPEGFVERHQVLLTRVAGDRLYFQNALKNPRAVGAEVGGENAGPLRRLESDGQESMPVLSLHALMGRGGAALLPSEPGDASWSPDAL